MPSRATLFTSLALGIAVAGAAAPAVRADEATGRKVIDVDRMTARQFREQLGKLPDDAVVVRKGERTTAGEIRARKRVPPDVVEARTRAIAERSRTGAARTEAEFQQARTRFLDEQRTRLEADNAKARAELARLREAATVEQEAARLWPRTRTASPAERAQIDEQARRLLRQLDDPSDPRR